MKLRPLLICCLLAGCAQAPARPSSPRAIAPTTTPPAPSSELLAAIDTGDLPRALHALCGAYAAGGTPCANTIYLSTLDARDMMSHLDEDGHVFMTPMPPVGGGLAYWDNWSAILAQGRWDTRALFASDDDARRIANMLLVTVLAHELGHHIARRYRCHPSDRPGGELRADELSVPLVAGLARGPLAELHTRMRAVADAMIAAVPAAERVEVPEGVDVRAWAAALPGLPTPVPAYVSLHLSRQRRLLEGLAPFAGVARRLCLDRFAARLASRVTRPGRVTTVAAFPLQPATHAVDRSGHVHAMPFIGPPGSFELSRVDGKAPAVAVDIAVDFLASRAVAFSPDRFAFGDGQTWFVVDRAAAGHLIARALPALPSEARGLGFDGAGALFVAYDEADRWHVRALGDVEPRWSIARDRPDSGWDDGPLDRAHAWPGTPFVVVGDRVVFFDHERHALRSVGADGVVTLAGSIEGLRDGAAPDAQLSDVDAIAALPDGRIAVLEQDRAKQTVVLRVVRPAGEPRERPTRHAP